jgi:phospholipase/carboxylesterase
VALYKILRVPDEIRFVFPVAPLSLNGEFQDERAWWMLDMEQIARDITSGRKRDVHAVPQGLSEARSSVIAVLDELEQQWHISSERIILGGFSQGAMLSCDTVLRTERPFAGLILLSGSLIAKEDWVPLMAKRKGLPVFQSHGTDDPLLSFQTAEILRNLLAEHGLSLDWHQFQGGHEIPFFVLKQLAKFLQSLPSTNC